ncbi:MAG: hypothetical protein JSS84_12845 [Bacteroidetes bacterium]|nr:hypothetical protein [Bacteroidota bacterium]
MNHKIPALAAAICLVSLNLHAQTITFQDQATRTPIADVSITCLATGATVVSNADGRADIAPLKNCDSIRIDHLSYIPVTMAWTALAATPEVDLGYRMYLLREVVTSGSRFTEPKRDVPEQIDVLGRRELIKNCCFLKICLYLSGKTQSNVYPPPPPEYTTSTGRCLPERW